eukprot:g21140.t1
MDLFNLQLLIKALPKKKMALGFRPRPLERARPAGVGALCYATYVLIEVSVGALSSFRFGFCQAEPFRSEEHCPKGQWISWGVNLLGFAASVVLGTWMAAASAFLVSRFAPAASGSGIPEVKTILNGFVLPDVATFRTLFIKVPCLILAVASGLSLGHEGPMVHVGVCWANLLSRLFPQFRNEGKRQQLFSAAVAAGVSSAFGTPVGGVLFSLEEVSSHFPSRTLLMAFVASVVATLLLSVSNLTGTGHLTLYSVTYTVTLHPSDYAMFALLGAAGGLVGALFNALNIRWCAFKAKASFRKWVGPVQEASFLAFLTLLSSWPLSLTRYLNAQTIHALLDTCSDEPGETVRSRLQAEFGLCTEDGYSNSSGNGLLTSLGFAAAIRFCQTVLTIGTACPAGLFVPSLFIGACLGRCLALGLKALNTGTRLFPHKIDPGVYSMVGAASVLGGVSRMTISLVVIMLELTGGLDYIVPFMISVLLAKAVGDSLNEGIYDLQIVLKGYPFLHEELDVTFTERCCDIMETGLVKLDLNLRPRLQEMEYRVKTLRGCHTPAEPIATAAVGDVRCLEDLRVMVRAFTFRGFPIVDGDFFVGYVRRSQLEDVLARMELVRGQNEVISLDDLLPVVDTTVMRMVPNAPLTQAHQVFKQLGCQRIFLDGTVGHIPDELRLAGSQMESNGASALRFSYEGPQQESTASHIRLGELFSVLDAAAEAGGEQRSGCGGGIRTEDQLSWAPSASDDEAHQRHEANGSPLSVGTGQPGPSNPSVTDALPEYWYHNKTPASVVFDEMYYTQDKDEKAHAAFDEMFKASYVASATRDRPCPSSSCAKTPGGCPCVQPGADPGLPVAYRTRRVIRVEAADMWRRPSAKIWLSTEALEMQAKPVGQGVTSHRIPPASWAAAPLHSGYVAKRARIRQNRSSEGIDLFDPEPKTQETVMKNQGMFAALDTSVNECYAFHGTFVRYALSIAENDFNIDLAGSSTGTLYGRGAYLGESITKADEYAKDEPGGYYEGVFAVLVCRVTMGKMNVTKNDPAAGDKVKNGEFDSTCGNRLFRELVIYYSDQCYPEYLVLYQRILQKTILFLSWMFTRIVVACLATLKRPTHLLEGGGPGIQHMQCLVNQARIEPKRTLQRCMRLEDAELWQRFVDFKHELQERLGEDGAVSNERGNPLRIDAVEKDLRALMKRPCKFFKAGNCKRADKCKFSHNEFAAALDDMGLAAGRRLPVDEMDRKLHEGFLWLACSTGDEAEEISEGSSKSRPFYEESPFFESLDAALKEEGTKYAVLCRVLCGVPGDNPEDADDKDCIILQVDDKNRRKVLIKDSRAVYPEYFLELYSPDDTDAAAPDSNEAPVDDPVEVPVAERAASAAEPKQTNEVEHEEDPVERPGEEEDPAAWSGEEEDPKDWTEEEDKEAVRGAEQFWYLSINADDMVFGACMGNFEDCAWNSGVRHDAGAITASDAKQVCEDDEDGDFAIIVDQNFTILKRYRVVMCRQASQLLIPPWK